MKNSFFKVRTVALLGLTIGCPLIALSGCSNSAHSSVDKSQDLARIKEGPSAEDMKAMQAASKSMGKPPGSK